MTEQRDIPPPPPPDKKIDVTSTGAPDLRTFMPAQPSTDRGAVTNQPKAEVSQKEKGSQSLPAGNDRNATTEVNAQGRPQDSLVSAQDQPSEVKIAKWVGEHLVEAKKLLGTPLKPESLRNEVIKKMDRDGVFASVSSFQIDPACKPLLPKDNSKPYDGPSVRVGRPESQEEILSRRHEEHLAWRREYQPNGYDLMVMDTNRIGKAMSPAGADQIGEVAYVVAKVLGASDETAKRIGSIADAGFGLAGAFTVPRSPHVERPPQSREGDVQHGATTYTPSEGAYKPEAPRPAKQETKSIKPEAKPQETKATKPEDKKPIESSNAQRYAFGDNPKTYKDKFSNQEYPIVGERTHRTGANTVDRATQKESFDYNQQIAPKELGGNGKVGIQQPGRINEGGPDSIVYDPIRKVIELRDPKLRGPDSSFPKVDEGKLNKWKSEADRAINGDKNDPNGGCRTGDAKLDAEIRQAWADGRMELVQINVRGPRLPEKGDYIDLGKFF